MTVDATGNVYVAEYWNCRIQKFAPAAETPAAFTANTTSGVAPLAVRFTDESTGDPKSWSWMFGDGGTSAERNPTHTYTTPGTYTVNLTVNTETGSATFSRPGYITVTAPKGDVTGDGEVDIGDVSKVAYMVVGKEPADLAADFNGNGAVDIGDAAKIAYFFVGKIEAL
ncbi:PKD domain-containing protein [Methanoculleus bourgensis]|uniref:PKD domain-containing protein n=1 Tax=Methanoculleus bourgensis TaxID=83986 RepID=UPI00373FD6C9